MKQLLVLSGKGGTGKTTVSSALIKLFNSKTYADCDVDAPNLHLVYGKEKSPNCSDFFGISKYETDFKKCIGCKKCMHYCKFNAISFCDGKCSIDKYSCEGCGVCEIICKNRAIKNTPFKSGKLMLFKTDVSSFSTAELIMGSGNSGKLVSEVKTLMKKNSIDCDLAIIDGSPGIGCPVIASISGVDFLLIVAEPSVSGFSDMKRIIYSSRRFNVPTFICINKYDVSLENTKDIELFCQKENIPLIGKIPFDETVITAVNSGLSITDFDCPAEKAIKEMKINLENIMV